MPSLRSADTATHMNVESTCEAILDLLLPHRRPAGPGGDPPAAAFAEQLRQLARFVSAGEPVVFTLPGFPCKSPNPAKVLGHLPDEGERLALRFLNGLCQAVEKVYAPGARLTICSDGHAFAPIIGVPDADIDAYGDELRAIIGREGLDRLSTFDMRQVFGDGLSYDGKRAELDARYAPSAEHVRGQIRTDDQALRVYRGMTRFLVEDTAEYSGTRSALQRECKARAYGMIQRSHAWGNLVADVIPDSFRLSIHPQPVGSPKFGIRLLEISDMWTTPWHSAVLRRTDGTPQLMRRSDAERLGRLVTVDGRPSHFVATGLSS